MESSRYIYMLVSCGCGIQNAMCTTFSGAVVRTTHMTGITTDIGKSGIDKYQIATPRRMIYSLLLDKW